MTISIVLVCLGGVMSGLNVGLFSIDAFKLKLDKVMIDNPQEQQQLVTVKT